MEQRRFPRHKARQAHQLDPPRGPHPPTCCCSLSRQLPPAPFAGALAATILEVSVTLLHLSCPARVQLSCSRARASMCSCSSHTWRCCCAIRSCNGCCSEGWELAPTRSCICSPAEPGSASCRSRAIAGGASGCGASMPSSSVSLCCWDMTYNNNDRKVMRQGMDSEKSMPKPSE